MPHLTSHLMITLKLFQINIAIKYKSFHECFSEIASHKVIVFHLRPRPDDCEEALAPLRAHNEMEGNYRNILLSP